MPSRPGCAASTCRRPCEGSWTLVRDRHAKEGDKVDEELADLAFRVADRLQLSTVQRALIDSAARVRASTPELGDLVRREQEQRMKARESADATQRGTGRAPAPLAGGEGATGGGEGGERGAKKLAQEAAGGTRTRRARAWLR